MVLEKTVVTFLFLAVVTLPMISSEECPPEAEDSTENVPSEMHPNKFEFSSLFTNPLKALAIPSDALGSITGGLMQSLTSGIGGLFQRGGTGQQITSDDSDKNTKEGISYRYANNEGRYRCGEINIKIDQYAVQAYPGADKCCDLHERCEMTIPPGMRRYGLQNDNPYTAYSCDCEHLFYTCLKTTRTEMTEVIGGIYFNNHKNPCFKYDYPIICGYRGKANECLAEIFDTSVPKIWLWRNGARY